MFRACGNAKAFPLQERKKKVKCNGPALPNIAATEEQPLGLQAQLPILFEPALLVMLPCHATKRQIASLFGKANINHIGTHAPPLIIRWRKAL
eukprot:1147280-Pelagomonas_calceolata.AAC.17